jgi:hypothetical protein
MNFQVYYIVKQQIEKLQESVTQEEPWKTDTPIPVEYGGEIQAADEVSARTKFVQTYPTRVITRIFRGTLNEIRDTPLTLRIEVGLEQVKPNPYRDLSKYPLDPAKIEGLRASIKNTHYWENVLARKVGDTFELAYGHHRIEAARQELGHAAKVWLTVRGMDDATMLKIMASENDEAWAITPSFILETVEAAKGFIASNKLEPSGGRRELCQKDESPTAHAIHTLLGWPALRVRQALAQLNAIKKDGLAPAAIAKLQTQQAVVELSRVVKEAKAAGEPLTPEKQIEIAEQVTAKVDQAAEKTINQAIKAAEKEEAPEPEDVIPSIEERCQETAEELNRILGKAEEKIDLLLDFKNQVDQQTFRSSLQVLATRGAELTLKIKTLFEREKH